METVLAWSEPGDTNIHSSWAYNIKQRNEIKNTQCTHIIA